MRSLENQRISLEAARLFHPDLRRAAVYLRRVEHAERVVAPDRRSAATEDDDTTFTSGKGGQVFMDEVVSRGLNWLAVRAARTDTMRERQADEVFANAGAGNGTTAIVGIGSGAEYGRIAHSSRELALHASG